MLRLHTTTGVRQYGCLLITLGANLRLHDEDARFALTIPEIEWWFGLRLGLSEEKPCTRLGFVPHVMTLSTTSTE